MFCVQIPYGTKLSITLALRERDLFRDEPFWNPDFAKCAVAEGTGIRVELSLDKIIDCLAPDGRCFLSKNVGFLVVAALLPRWSAAQPVPFGEVVTVIIGTKPVHAISTTWPGREVQEPLAKAHIQALFCRLDLPTWDW